MLTLETIAELRRLAQELKRTADRANADPLDEFKRAIWREARDQIGVALFDDPDASFAALLDLAEQSLRSQTTDPFVGFQPRELRMSEPIVTEVDGYVEVTHRLIVDPPTMDPPAESEGPQLIRKFSRLPTVGAPTRLDPACRGVRPGVPFCALHGEACPSVSEMLPEDFVEPVEATSQFNRLIGKMIEDGMSDPSFWGLPPDQSPPDADVPHERGAES